MSESTQPSTPINKDPLTELASKSLPVLVLSKLVFFAPLGCLLILLMTPDLLNFPEKEFYLPFDKKILAYEDAYDYLSILLLMWIVFVYGVQDFKFRLWDTLLTKNIKAIELVRATIMQITVLGLFANTIVFP